MEHLGLLRYLAYLTHAGVKAAVTVLERALAGGLELSIAGGTPVAASRGYKRGRRTNAAAETRGSASRGSRNKERVQGRRSTLRNHAEASP